MTSTSVLGRTRSSPWAPSVSVGWEPRGQWVCGPSWLLGGFLGHVKGGEGVERTGMDLGFGVRILALGQASYSLVYSSLICEVQTGIRAS